MYKIPILQAYLTKFNAHNCKPILKHTSANLFLPVLRNRLIQDPDLMTISERASQELSFDV